MTARTAPERAFPAPPGPFRQPPARRRLKLGTPTSSATTVGNQPRHLRKHKSRFKLSGDCRSEVCFLQPPQYLASLECPGRTGVQPGIVRIPEEESTCSFEGCSLA